MSEIMFTIGGKSLTSDQIKQRAPKAPPRRKAAEPNEEAVDAFGVRGKSDGFVVLGYSPDHWAEKDADYRKAIKAHEEAPNENKHPGTPGEFEIRWRNRNKPKRARSKPYELSDAADQCAELMRKAGWLHVRVEELRKG